jgi:3-hydroxyethyl bacteriochlorophyllide a dehydrogenase
MAGMDKTPPDLIVGHGVLGRLLARLTIAAGAPAPTVWEVSEDRMTGASGYDVIHPDADEKRDYRSIYDASGKSDLLNSLIGRIEKGGEIVLAGFYTDTISFAFPPAFMKEARLRVAAEWDKGDLAATRSLIEAGALKLDGLVTHTRASSDAPGAYQTAFNDPACLKMILDWSAAA